MKMRAMLTVAAAAAFSTIPTFAQDDAILGFGAYPCEKYVEYRDLGQHALASAVATWVQGYLTAENVELMRRDQPILRYVAPDDMDAFLLKDCQAHLHDPIFASAGRLAHSLSAQR